MWYQQTEVHTLMGTSETQLNEKKTTQQNNKTRKKKVHK